MRKPAYKVHCVDCEGSMIYRDRRRADFEAQVHADLYNHDAFIIETTLEIDPLFELEGY